MADTHETIADIVRKMRNEIAELRKVSPNVPSIAADWWEARADEIEAAHKREAGDAAKLREAVKAVVDVGYPHNFQAEAPHIYGYCCDITRAIEKCFAALSTPPRNCDLPEVAKDPWRAWLDDKSNWDEFGSPKLEIHDWLLAPATGKEGGAK